MIRDYQLRADKEDKRHVEVHADLHERGVQGDDALCLREVGSYVLRGGAELLFFVVLTRKALDDAHSADIFLDRLVQAVVFSEHASERWHCLAADKIQTDGKYRNDDHKRRCKRAAHYVSHDYREYEHEGGAYGYPDYHHESHLHVCDVGGQPCDKRRGGKFVDICEGVGLYLLKEVGSQVLCEPGRCLCAGEARKSSAAQRQDGEKYQNPAYLQYFGYPGSGLYPVHHLCRDKRYDTFDDRLTYDEYQRKDSRFFELPYALCKSFQHMLFLSLLMFVTVRNGSGFP